jgi:hypothetical protein
VTSDEEPVAEGQEEAAVQGGREEADTAENGGTVRQAEREGKVKEKEAVVLKIQARARGMSRCYRQGTRTTREIPHQQSTPHTSPVLSLCSFHPCPVLVEGSS